MRIAPALVSRLFAAAIGAAALALLWYLPALLQWHPPPASGWAATLQLAGPALAGVLAVIAAWRSSARERRAWTLIAAALLLQIVASTPHIADAMAALPPRFPLPTDALLFVVAMLVAAAVWRYPERVTLPASINAFNFVLLHSAMVFGTLFLLHHAIKASQLSEFATVVAFLHAALWGSVAALAALLLVLYPSGQRRLTMLLLTLALTAQAVASLVYATQLMNRTYAFGGWPHLLWLLSAALVAWAAVEHVLEGPRRSESGHGRALSWVSQEHLIGQSIAPALVILVILMTGTFAGAFGRGLYQHLAAVLTFVTTITVGLREYRIEGTRRQLQQVAEQRLADLKRGEERLASVLESTSDSVLVVDLDWKVQFFNNNALRFIPELEVEGIGGSFWGLFRPSERTRFAGTFEAVMTTGEPLLIETYNEARGIWVELRAYSTGSGISLFFRDISEEKRTRDEIAYLAHNDFLTGLSSRSVFNRALAERPEASASRAVLLADLDFFKDINDTLGHATGDRVLTEVARRIRDAAPADALVARLGGDEFGLVIDGAGEGEVLRLAERIVTAVSEPIIGDQQTLVVGATVGVALAEPSWRGADLFTRADIALYEAKARGRGQALLFEPQMEQRLVDRNRLQSDLGKAIENEELQLAYQPLLDTRTGTIAGFEALLRWRHPGRGLIPPDQFIPLAEESGLMVPIGEWVLRTACAEAKRWPPHLSVSINVSTRQLADLGFIVKVVNAIHDTELDHRRVEIEVTESALMRSANVATLTELTELGIRVALDDFGTGYSSLGYLQSFSFDKLKIDRSFVAKAPHDPRSRAIVETVVSLARTLGMLVTVEGIETPEQLAWVSNYCDQVQGFLVGRPLWAQDIPAYLSTNESGLEKLRA